MLPIHALLTALALALTANPHGPTKTAASVDLGPSITFRSRPSIEIATPAPEPKAPTITVNVPLSIVEQTGDWIFGFGAELGPPYLPAVLKIQKGTDKPGHFLMPIPAGLLPLGAQITEVRLFGVGLGGIGHEAHAANWTILKLRGGGGWQESTSLTRARGYQTWTEAGTAERLDLDPKSAIVDSAAAYYLVVHSDDCANVPLVDGLTITFQR